MLSVKIMQNITTVKPNISVNRREAVLPQARGKTVLLEHILNLL